MRSDDEIFVNRCLEGDQPAFAFLVDKYKEVVHAYAYRKVGDYQEAEDITQEVFLRAYQAMPRFEGRSAFKTWLYKIAHNLCLTEIAKRGRRGEHLSLEEEGEEKVHWMLPDNRPGLMDEIERRDFSKSVWALVDQLPENYRTALTLFYVEQARYEEIAEIMFKLVSRFGCPRRLLTDRGTQFISHVLRDPCYRLGTQKVFTSAYRPQADGIAEAFMKVLGNQLAILVEGRHRSWDTCLPQIELASRTTPHPSTG